MPTGTSKPDGNSKKAVLFDRANAIFDKMGATVEAALNSGAKQLDVLQIANQAGLQIDQDDLEQLEIPRMLIPHTFLPWYQWWPWRQLWAFYMAQNGFFQGSESGQLSEQALEEVTGGAFGTASYKLSPAIFSLIRSKVIVSGPVP